MNNINSAIKIIVLFLILLSVSCGNKYIELKNIKLCDPHTQDCNFLNNEFEEGTQKLFFKANIPEAKEDMKLIVKITHHHENHQVIFNKTMKFIVGEEGNTNLEVEIALEQPLSKGKYSLNIDSNTKGFIGCGIQFDIKEGADNNISAKLNAPQFKSVVNCKEITFTKKCNKIPGAYHPENPFLYIIWDIDNPAFYDEVVTSIYYMGTIVNNGNKQYSKEDSPEKLASLNYYFEQESELDKTESVTQTFEFDYLEEGIYKIELTHSNEFTKTHVSYFEVNDFAN